MLASSRKRKALPLTRDKEVLYKHKDMTIEFRDGKVADVK